MQLDTSKFDFLDFGSSIGGSINLAKKRFGGRTGLGIDRSPEQCALARKAGFDVVCADACSISIPKKSVRFSVLAHFLEHLPGISETRLVLRNAVYASTDFVFIEGPSFDFDDYLKNRGLKFFWSDGCGHTNRLQLTTLRGIADRLPIHSYTILFELPFVQNSKSRDIHSLDSPNNVTYYDAKIHPPKPFVKFDKAVFRSFIMFLWVKNLGGTVRTNLLRGRPKFKTVLTKRVQ